MEKRDFQRTISAHISASEAMAKIGKVVEWWGVTCSGCSENLNDEFVVKMTGNSYFNFTVAELIPGKKVVWLVTDCHMPWYSDKKAWKNHKLIFDLSENNGITELKFTHEGLTPDVECFKDCESGWTHWITTSLYSFFTTGKGQLKQRIPTTYSVAIEVSKSELDVFDHIIQLSKWWVEQFVGQELKLNAEFVLKVGETHFSKNKVIELVPGKKFVWITTESKRSTDNFDWTGTKMIFELSPIHVGTQINFTYDGVVLENEKERLTELCDYCIKDLLYNYLASFTATIEVSNSPLEVFKILTEDVSKWWGGNDLSGNTLKLNDEFVVHHKGAHYSKQKLIEVIPGKKLAWVVTDSTLHWLKTDQQEWTNTKMIFEISTNSDKTTLHFTHLGLVPNKECYEACHQGWTMVITDWLFNYINQGKINERFL